MSVELVTGYYGKPHINQEYDRSFNYGTIGKNVVLNAMDKFELSTNIISSIECELTIGTGLSILNNGALVINDEPITKTINLEQLTDTENNDIFILVGINVNNVISTDGNFDQADITFISSESSEPSYDEEHFTPLYYIYSKGSDFNNSFIVENRYEVLLGIEDILDNIDGSNSKLDYLESLINKNGIDVEEGELSLYSSVTNAYSDNKCKYYVIGSLCIVTGVVKLATSVTQPGSAKSIFMLPYSAKEQQYVQLKRNANTLDDNHVLFFRARNSEKNVSWVGKSPQNEITYGSGSTIPINSFWRINH